jgi:3-hydroxyanthranilate 3,4-dioxygenase
LFDAFYENESRRCCPHCGSIHPGQEPPAGWAVV